MAKNSFWDTGLGKFINVLTFGVPRIIQGISQSGKNSDGSSNSALGAFNTQNWENAAGDILLGDDYQNNQPLGQQLFGTNLGGLIQSLTNRITANELTGAEREANAFSAEQAQIDRDFQERMANTQYQRGVADMRAAGVNPALAMSNGGAAAPSGQAVSSVQPQGQAMNMSDLMHLLMLKPQIRLMEKQGDAALLNAKAANRQAGASEKGVEIQGEELRTVKQPLAMNQIKVGDSVYTLNQKRADKVDAEVRQLAEDTELTKLHQIADALDIQYKLETWEDNKRMLSEMIAKTQAERIYSYALSSKASEETRSAALANDWTAVVNKYWTDPANVGRGVNLEMLKGTNAAAATFAYLQSLGDIIDEDIRADDRAFRNDFLKQKGGSR